MGLTENTPAALLALHCLDVRPNSAATPGHVMALRAAGGGLASSSPQQRWSVLAEAPRRFSTTLRARKEGPRFHRDPVGRT